MPPPACRTSSSPNTSCRSRRSARGSAPTCSSRLAAISRCRRGRASASPSTSRWCAPRRASRSRPARSARCTRRAHDGRGDTYDAHPRGGAHAARRHRCVFCARRLSEPHRAAAVLDQRRLAARRDDPAASKQLGATLGQTFVVDNRPGGSGVVAMTALMGQPADGYTILSTTSSMSFTMAMNSRLPYSASDFTILPALQAEPSAVAVRADSRFKTLAQLVDAMRATPDKLSVGGFSAGGFHQFVFYRLQQEGKFKSAWIPFKCGKEAGTALLGGHIDVAVITPRSALAQIQHGDIRLIGISSGRRDQYFPDVPTFKEQGFDVVERIWRGVMLKAGTPAPVIDALSRRSTG